MATVKPTSRSIWRTTEVRRRLCLPIRRRSFYTSGSLTSVYRGVGLFTFGDGIGYGTVTGFSEYVNGALTLDVSGFSVSGVGVAPTITTGNIGMLFPVNPEWQRCHLWFSIQRQSNRRSGKGYLLSWRRHQHDPRRERTDIAVLTGQYKQYTITGYLEGNTSYKTFAHQDGASKTTVAGVGASSLMMAPLHSISAEMLDRLTAFTKQPLIEHQKTTD